MLKENHDYGYTKHKKKTFSAQDVEERFRKAMIANAQMDNERASQTYQIQLLKDKLDEMDESYAQLHREYRDKSRDHDALRRANDKFREDLRLVQGQLNERDQLIAEQGLTIVIVENEDGTDARRALVSVENAQLLEKVQGSLGKRLNGSVDGWSRRVIISFNRRQTQAIRRGEHITQNGGATAQPVTARSQDATATRLNERTARRRGPGGCTT